MGITGKTRSLHNGRIVDFQLCLQVLSRKLSLTTVDKLIVMDKTNLGSLILFDS